MGKKKRMRRRRRKKFVKGWNGHMGFGLENGPVYP